MGANWYADWTEERKQQVKDYWAQGYTATQIAGMLDIAVTRNAIIGLCHRNGWERPGMIGRPRKPTPTKHERPAPRPAPPPPPPKPKAIPPGFRGLTFWELGDHHCRWIRGDGDKVPYSYCGQVKLNGSSYCPSCYRKAHNLPGGNRGDHRGETEATT